MKRHFDHKNIPLYRNKKNLFMIILFHIWYLLINFLISWFIFIVEETINEKGVAILHEPSYPFSSDEGNKYSRGQSPIDDLSGSIQEHTFNYVSMPWSNYNINAVDRTDKRSSNDRFSLGNSKKIYNFKILISSVFHLKFYNDYYMQNVFPTYRWICLFNIEKKRQTRTILEETKEIPQIH